MSISILDLFKIGIGPSSSHTVGPMKAARLFAMRLYEQNKLEATTGIRVELFGSLGATGKGHGSDKAVMLGLEGEEPETIDTDEIEGRLQAIRSAGALNLLGLKRIRFDESQDLLMHKRKSLPLHPNAMKFSAIGTDGKLAYTRIYYSVGGGFVLDESEATRPKIVGSEIKLTYPFDSGDQLLALCAEHGLRIDEIMLANELAWRPERETREALLAIWRVMQACVKKGCHESGILPGGMKVRRRAAALYQDLIQSSEASLCDPLSAMDWVDLYALAVNEENAAGGRIVTAPTNGAAGIIPAVLHYYARFSRHADDEGVIRFLLTAGAIGVLYKKNASISGAEVGCQGEVGSACSMAAGGLAAVMGGSPDQVENAAEIGMEHNLGLTCDPVGGLVQVPCIERNAMAAVKAINAARIALKGDGKHFVSLDRVIKTMRDTGADMKTKYKETARGGLAVNVIEVPVNFPEC
ncbi:MAG: L-serine ammonia-lyase [Gammaproteobacteria bacterium]|nr:L-serine ammonia-lyase [Gammaproteobacteria bacterium]